MNAKRLSLSFPTRCLVARVLRNRYGFGRMLRLLYERLATRLRS